MICVIPAYLLPGNDFWLSKKGKELLLKLISTLKGFGTETIMAGDNSNLLDIGAEAGATCIEAVIPASMLPPWQAACRQLFPLLQNMERYSDEDLLFIDFRYPQLTKQTLTAAVAQFAEQRDKPLLASITQINDHLPQCKTPWEVVAGGPIHIRDDSFHMENHKGNRSTTRPFHFQWPHSCPEGSYLRHPDILGYELTPTSSKNGESAIWIKQKETTRITYPTVDQSEYGFTWADDFTEIKPRIRKQDGGFQLSFKNIEGPSLHKLWIFPFRDDTIYGNSSQNLILRSPVDVVELQDTGQSGWWYILCVESAQADFIEPFCPPDAFWSLNSAMNPVSKSTGKPLIGRQVMPESYIVNGAIVLAASKMHSDGLQKLTPSNTTFFALTDEDGLRVEGELDLLRAKARRKAEERSV